MIKDDSTTMFTFTEDKTNFLWPLPNAQISKE